MIFSFFSIASELSVADSLINRLELAESDSELLSLQIALYEFYDDSPVLAQLTFQVRETPLTL